MTMVSKNGFRKGMDLYFERHDGEAATVEDFMTSMADANNIELDQFLLWYSQAGTPQVMGKLDYNKKRQEAKLTFHQICPRTPGQSAKKPQHIPIKLGLLGPDGTDYKLLTEEQEPFKDDLFHLTKREQSIKFTNIPEKPVVSLFREFSAPVHLNMSLTERDLEFQSLHDTDLFNRWQATQTYASRLMVELVKIVASGKKSKKGARFSKVIGENISDESLEEAYRAECMTLPGETDIAREIGKNVNPLHIHQARNMLINNISKDLNDLLLNAYEKSSIKGKYTPSARNIGKRAFRNATLYLLSSAKKADDIERVANHYWKAKNMTDKNGRADNFSKHNVT